ncbi:helicase RepA family protein [Aeoliella sp. ICT_H6.2]|uniref:Helicase RepA family protein n=1 Tax=Aeoliella straminimaris TaxID=2954799 RepID=A0A9X2JF34_9BACT|nr:helicase RepA family protein [Aeoliella straminimaris]MCO6043645.1 helicase RepA family protein [Aeoliella straminimaris]
MLAPIAKLAEQHGAAVLMVAHRRKGAAQSADDTALGSRAFTGLARSVWHISRDPDDDQRRLLLPGKSNLAAVTTGLAFSIMGEPASVHWDDEPVRMSADDALARETGNATGELSALDEAVAWLAEYLATGPHPGKAVRKAAEADGIANRTLDRARGKLQVKAEPDGFGGPWVWRLPDDHSTECANVAPESTEYAKEDALAHTGDTVAHSDGSALHACSHCGSTDLREVPIHDGRSIRRDCSRCSKMVDFPVWRPA